MPEMATCDGVHLGDTWTLQSGRLITESQVRKQAGTEKSRETKKVNMAPATYIQQPHKFSRFNRNILFRVRPQSLEKSRNEGPEDSRGFCPGAHIAKNAQNGPSRQKIALEDLLTLSSCANPLQRYPRYLPYASQASG